MRAAGPAARGRPAAAARAAAPPEQQQCDEQHDSPAGQHTVGTEHRVQSTQQPGMQQRAVTHPRSADSERVLFFVILG
jgi:hypothetical protein